MEVKVLGTGCATCQKLYERVQEAIALSGRSVTLTKVKSLPGMMAYGVMMPPALVVDEQVKCEGRMPSMEEIVGWIASGS